MRGILVLWLDIWVVSPEDTILSKLEQAKTESEQCDRES